MLTEQTLSNKDLKKILRKFNLGKPISVESIPTSGNVSYIVTTNLKKYFLRLCPSKGQPFRSVGEIYAEIELLYFLKRNCFPVLIPIKNKNRKNIISINNHNGYMREFIADNYKENPTLKQIEEFGRALGRFHSLTEKFNPKNEREHIFDLKRTREFFKENSEYIMNSTFKNKKRFISKIKCLLPSIYFPENLPSGMIHEDLGKRHILWNGERISAIIDFDRVYFGKLILDLGQACRGWCFTDKWASWSNEHFKYLIKGYSKRRILTNLEKKYLVDAIKFGIIERAISFCLRFISSNKDPEDEEYALCSVLNGGLLDLIDKNKKEVNSILLNI